MTMPTSGLNDLAIDGRNLNALRLQAKQSPGQALKQAASLFESELMSIMLKAMREATPQDGIFDSEQTKTFTAMLDQQLAQNLSAKGIGLADVLVKQLSHQVAQPAATAATAGFAQGMPRGSSEHARQLKFIQKMLPAALQASRNSGVPIDGMLGQAALESGWGQREIHSPDGEPSYNLFGIKAGTGWKGKVAPVVTTEYQQGQRVTQVAKFRAYASYEDAFNDYARLLSNNPRYAKVLHQSNSKAFADAMQQAGYATDPAYGDKLAHVIDQVNTLG
jgi:flagellar protein FlgJ